MLTPPVPPDEAQRLAALTALGILDTPVEDRFDRLARLAQEVFAAPIALVSLVDQDRQWFKSHQGLDVRETGREESFCAHAIVQDDVFVVPDTHADVRFADNPLVTGEPGIRFYAGAPLATQDGHNVGTLCVIDTVARTWTPEQSHALRVMADLVQHELNQSRLHDQQRALITLTTITALTDDDQRELLRRALHLGCEFLGMPIGIASHIDGDDYEVLVQVSPPGTLYDGQKFDLGETYCQITLQGKDVLAIPHVGASAHQAHPCYRAMRLESYVGVPIDIDGRTFGTLNFSSPEPRPAAGFSEPQLDFVRLLGRWVSAGIRRWQLDEALRRQQERAQVIERAQSKFIVADDRAAAFDALLLDTLALTKCSYGFLGEVRHDDDGQPYLKTHAIHDVSWDDETRLRYQQRVEQGVEMHDLDGLYGPTLRTGEALIHDGPVDGESVASLPSAPESIDSYLGLPVRHGRDVVGMIGLANKPGGFVADDIAFLEPLTATLGQLIRVWRTVRQRREDQRAIARLSLVASQMPTGVVMTDRQGQVEWVNDAFSRLTGFPAEAVAGSHPSDILGWGGEAGDADSALAASMDRREPFHGEVQIQDRSGRWMWVQVDATSLSGAAGEPLGHMIMLSDITERRRIERMKQEFVSTVSHELRTPLTSISGALRIIDSGMAGELPGQVAGMVEIAYRNADRLTRLINDLLDMEKLVEGKVRLDLQVRELMPVIDHALAENEGYASQFGVRLVVVERADGVRVDVDALRLHQVLSNLLSNAAKFSRSGDLVEVSVRRESPNVRVEVVDRGAGIPAEFQGRIFEKFSQADSSDARTRGGTGLGLAISKELVERMGGSIGFTSKEGRGTTFWFTLPIVRRKGVEA